MFSSTEDPMTSSKTLFKELWATLLPETSNGKMKCVTQWCPKKE